MASVFVDGAEVVLPYLTTRAGWPVVWAGISGRGWFEVVTDVHPGKGIWCPTDGWGATESQAALIVEEAEKLCKELA